MVSRERLQDVLRFKPAGRLLEIGCAEGEFLSVASSEGFQSIGLETDPGSTEAGRSRGLDVQTGSLSDAGFLPAQFDVVVMYHVIEHLDSPRRTLMEISRVLRPGGLLALETPNVDTFWFRLLGERWRQLIPDHYFFFSPETIARLLDQCGFRVLEIHRVGKSMSLRLFLDRLRRMNRPVGQAAMAVARMTRIENFTVRMNLGDVMRVHARRI